jgi:hypothetical protein
VAARAGACASNSARRRGGAGALGAAATVAPASFDTQPFPIMTGVAAGAPRKCILVGRARQVGMEKFVLAIATIIEYP